MDRKKKILIAEDEAALSRVMNLKFTGSGFNVIVVNDGNIFSEIFDKENPDLVLLDLMIPGLDGFSILKEIKEVKRSKVPVIILSNLGQSEDKSKAKELGATDYFVKSDISISEIVEKIKLILNK
jgi:DNA-binding response OmpR family regulator